MGEALIYIQVEHGPRYTQIVVGPVTVRLPTIVGAEFTTRPKPKRHKSMTGRSSISAYYIACLDQGPDTVALY